MVEWIALNDNPEDMDAESISGNTIVCMVADLTGRTQEEIGKEIVIRREIWKQGREMPVQYLKA
jgi:hypothetical protein